MKLFSKTGYWAIMIALMFAAMVVANQAIPSTYTEIPPTEQETVTPDKTSSSDKTDKPNSAGVVDTDVENQRRFDALKNELRRELLDDRADTINWWLTATAIFLTFFALLVAIVGYFGFNRFRNIEKEAYNNVEESKKHVEKMRGYAKEAQELVEKIGERKREDEETNQYIQRERHEASSDKAEQVREPGQEDEQISAESSFDQVISEAVTLEREGKIEEAIEKWRSIANDAEDSDNDLAARAWLSIATLLQEGDTDAEEQ